MRYNKWKTGLNIEREFLKSLTFLNDIFGLICKNYGSDREEYYRRMVNFQNTYQYENFINSSVKRMVTAVSNLNMSTWRRASKKATKNPLFYRELMREINEELENDINSQVIENAALIRTLPSDVAGKVLYDIRDYTFEGYRASDISSLIKEKTDKHAKASERLIARTEVSKTTTALTKVRSENLGINWYVWRTVLDGLRVRKSHRIMEGVLVNWNMPPSPERLAGEKDVGIYHAGNIWNCRCYPEPLISVDDIKWPHKIYINGRIESIRKKEFEKIL